MANLREANLSVENLREANLSGAITSEKFISISCIGSNKRMTTINLTKNIVWFGCFTGTLEEFEARVKETHNDNKTYLNEYIGFINYIKGLNTGTVEK